MKLETSNDRLLFTPGPLTTSRTVKQALLCDLGSRDAEFMALTQEVRRKLLDVAGVSHDTFTTVLQPGSGTFSVESVLTGATAPGGKLLIIANGAYGSRMAQIAKVARIEATVLNYGEDEKPDLREIDQTLVSDAAITNVAMVHCETTSGIVNPIEEVGRLAKKYSKTYFVDAMSSFGAMPIDFENIDYLVSSANKCIEGVPGLGFVIARREALMRSEGWARSLSFDLFAQWKDLEQKSEFRYTPPIQITVALNRALDELFIEGGVEARQERYQANHRTLLEGMRNMGFKTYLPERDMGFIITSFRYLEHPQFNYKELYERLRERGAVIYSGKVSNAECFRVGNIGRIFPGDVKNLLAAMGEVLAEMGVHS